MNEPPINRHVGQCVCRGTNAMYQLIPSTSTVDLTIELVIPFNLHQLFHKIAYTTKKTGLFLHASIRFTRETAKFGTFDSEL